PLTQGYLSLKDKNVWEKKVNLFS
ncbi:uncharacterized protein METZ01_LOCUS244402, partial [marine metagenome]